MRTVLLLPIALAKMCLPFNSKSCNLSKIEQGNQVTYYKVQHGANNPKQPLSLNYRHHEGHQL